MQEQTITFQLGTNFLSKLALRLECLFLTIEQACNEIHPVIHHYALKNVIEIIKIIEKPELKSRFLKEFMRIEHAIHKSQITLSENLRHRLNQQTSDLNQSIGRFGSKISQNPFLQAIRLAQADEHNDGELHSPQLLLWLEHDAEKRKNDLHEWLTDINTLQSTISTYLNLLRKTAFFETITLLNGFYQCSLPSKMNCHLILLRMDKNSGVVPKMSLGHHGLSLRLCEANSMAEIKQFDRAIDLGICQI